MGMIALPSCSSQGGEVVVQRADRATGGPGLQRFAELSQPAGCGRSTAKRALVLAQEWGLLARIDRTPCASCQPSTTGPPPQPSTVKPVPVTGVVLLDLVLRRDGETITRFTTAADPTNAPNSCCACSPTRSDDVAATSPRLLSTRWISTRPGSPNPTHHDLLSHPLSEASSAGGAERN
jgi:hypothetical protein